MSDSDLEQIRRLVQLHYEAMRLGWFIVAVAFVSLALQIATAVMSVLNLRKAREFLELSKEYTSTGAEKIGQVQTQLQGAEARTGAMIDNAVSRSREAHETH